VRAEITDLIAGHFLFIGPASKTAALPAFLLCPAALIYQSDISRFLELLIVNQSAAQPQ